MDKRNENKAWFLFPYICYLHFRTKWGLLIRAVRLWKRQTKEEKKEMILLELGKSDMADEMKFWERENEIVF